MKKLVIYLSNSFRMNSVQSFLRYNMESPMTFIAKGCEIFKGIIPLSLRESLSLSVNMVKMKVTGRSAFYTFAPIPFMGGDAVPTVIVVFLCVATVGSLTDLVSAYPSVDLLNIIFALAFIASMLICGSKYELLATVGTVKNTPDFIRSAFLSVFTKAKNIIHSVIFWIAGITHLMICASFLERFFANLTDCFSIPHCDPPISFLHYTGGER